MNVDTVLKTVLIAGVAAGGAFFTASWDSGFTDAIRASGGAFFATAGVLLVFLKVDPRAGDRQP